MTEAAFKLAVAACRWSFSSDNADEIRLLSGTVDWADFLHMTRRHRIQSIASRSLRENGISPPAAVAEALAADEVEIAAANLRSAAESFRLQEAFRDRSLSILFVKGLTLSALAYGDPFVKMSSDVDILIDPAALSDASRVLAALSYRCTVPAVGGPSPELEKWHSRLKESVWVNSSSGIALELHTRLADNPDLIPGIGIDSPHQLVSVGQFGTLPTLGTDDLFAYLCVHGASSAWFRLKWIADLIALLSAAGGHNVDRLYGHALSKGAGRAPAQALLLADTLSLVDLPPLLRGEMQRDRISRALSSLAARELLARREPTQRMLGTAPTHLSQAFLPQGWKSGLSESSRRLRDIAFRRGRFPRSNANHE